jgi:DNA-binding GntR family transcriptional regulator
MIEKISSETLQEKAYKAIKESILRNVFLPNEVLSIDSLAKSLGISPTPVREALGRLNADGLIEYESHRQPRVANISAEEVRQVYQVRRLLEPYVASVVAERVPGDPALRETLRGLRSEAETAHEMATEPVRDLSALREAVIKTDLDLQSIMERALGPSLLAQSMRFIGNHSLRIRSFVEAVAEPGEGPGVSRAITGDHCRILDGLCNGDAVETSAAQLAHLDNAEKRTLAALAGWEARQMANA